MASHKIKKIKRRNSLNAFIAACHGLLEHARKLGISTRKVRKLLFRSQPTGKRYRNNVPGSFGKNGYMNIKSMLWPPADNIIRDGFCGNAHDRRIQRRAARINTLVPSGAA